MSNLFWRRWLMMVMVGVMFYGACLILLPQTMHRFFNTLFFSSSESIQNADHDLITLIYGVLGAVLIGWMVALLSIVVLMPATHQHVTWQIIALSIGVWFTIDTGFSIYTGFVAHALFNVGFLVLFAVPLWAMRRG